MSYKKTQIIPQKQKNNTQKMKFYKDIEVIKKNQNKVLKEWNKKNAIEVINSRMDQAQ